MDAALSSSLAALSAASKTLSSGLAPPVSAFERCAVAAARAIAANPTSERAKSAALAPLGAHMEDVDEAALSAGAGDICHAHLTALSAAARGYGCVAADDPAGSVADARAFCLRRLAAVRAKGSEHAKWADALDRCLLDMAEYCKRELPGPIGSSTAATTAPVAARRAYSGRGGGSAPVSAAPPKAAPARATPSWVAPARAAPVMASPGGGDVARAVGSMSLYGAEDVVSVAAFNAIIAGPLAEYLAASDKLGAELRPANEAFIGAWKAVADFLAMAATKPKPAEPDFSGVGGLMSKVGEAAAEYPPRGALSNHVTAIGESVAALGWVAVDSGATGFVGDQAGAGQMYVDRVKMAAKKTDDPTAHRAWAAAIEELFKALKAYVKDYHTNALVWNSKNMVRTAGSMSRGRSAAVERYDDVVSGPDAVSGFKAIVEGPLAEYLAASEKLGRDLRPANEAFTGAWKAEAEFIAMAATNPKPTEPDFSGIGGLMGKAGEAAAEYPPRGALSNHVTAIGESVAALGWVGVDSGATGFVSDQAGAGQMYVDRVKMAAKNTDDPSAHRAWAAALEELFKALKAYVKEHHTNTLVWNSANMARKARSTSRGPPGGGGGFGGIDGDGGAGADPVSGFKAIVDGPLAEYLSTSEKLGTELRPANKAFAGAWKAEAEFIAMAATKPKPAEPDFAEIGVLMGKVGEAAAEYPPRGALSNHVTAIGESVAALGWVAVDSGATGFVGDQAGAGQMYVDRVKMAARKTDNPDAHRAWATALEELFKALKAYVEEHHTNTLVWNSGGILRKVRSTSRGRSAGDGGYGNGDGPSADDPVSGFKAIVDGPLAEYLSASDKLGAELRPANKVFTGAWKAEADFIAMAATTPKPAEPDFSKIGGLMGKVGEAAAEYPPRGALSNHVTAIGESVAALGWVAVDSGATGFVGDQAGAGQMYIDRVKMAAKKTEDPAAHRAWATALEDMFMALKAYVKEYHTNSLVWNSASRSRSADRGRSTNGASVRSGGSADSNSLSAFADFVSGPVKDCRDAGVALGGGVADQSRAMFDAFAEEYKMLIQAAKCPKPDGDDFASLIEPIGDAMGIVADAAETTNDNLMTAMAESIPAIGWVAVGSTPKSFVTEYADAGAFYVSKALTQARSLSLEEKKETQAFCRCLKNMYTQLADYVKTYHASGLVWNSKVNPPSGISF